MMGPRSVLNACMQPLRMLAPTLCVAVLAELCVVGLGVRFVGKLRRNTLLEFDAFHHLMRIGSVETQKVSVHAVLRTACKLDSCLVNESAPSFFWNSKTIAMDLSTI